MYVVGNSRWSVARFWIPSRRGSSGSVSIS